MTDDCATVGYGIVSLILIMVESSHWYTRSSATYYTIFCTPLETATWIPASPVLRRTCRYKLLPHRIQRVSRDYYLKSQISRSVEQSKKVLHQPD